MLIYSVILALNMVILYGIIRWRGLLSVEGLGLAYLAFMLGSDFISVVLNVNAASLLGDPFEFRSVPALVHALGLVLLAAGLFIADPHPKPIKRALTEVERQFFVSAAKLLVVLGVCMWVLMMVSEDLRGIGDYLANMNRLQVEPRRLGQFLDRWSNISLFGMAILVVIGLRSVLPRMALVGMMVAISFLFTPSKASITLAVLVLYVAAESLSPKLSKVVRRPWILAGLAAIIFLSMGIKYQIRYVTGSFADLVLSPSSIVGTASDIIQRRFSSSGLFEGYALAINRLMRNPSDHLNGRMLTYVFTGSVPRFLWQGKPENPTRQIGYLFDIDGQWDPLTAHAPTLVGWAFLDYGFFSLFSYLPFGGMLLGLIRRQTVSRENSSFRFLWYLVLLAVFPYGLSETGFDGLLNAIIVSTGVIAFIYIFSPKVSIPRNSVYKPGT